MTSSVARSVVLPTYNEVGNIGDLIDAIIAALESGPLYEVLVVDDGSPDGTASAARERFRDRSEVRVIERHDARGLATAIRFGIERSEGAAIAVMDTDFNHPPRLLPEMFRRLADHDLVVGSRFIQGGGMADRRRHYLSLAFNLITRVVLGIPTTDNLSGLFAIRRECLWSVDFDAVFYGYGDYYIRLLQRAARQGLRIAEVPVYYAPRRHGESKTRLLPVLARYGAAVIRARIAGGR